jgi:hypothetical protein
MATDKQIRNLHNSSSQHVRLYIKQKEANDKLQFESGRYTLLAVLSFCFSFLFIDSSGIFFLWALAIYFLFKTMQKIWIQNHKHFCPQCSSEAEYELVHSEYIDTTPIRMDGQHDQRYDKTGHFNDTWNYVCTQCRWQSSTNPNPFKSQDDLGESINRTLRRTKREFTDYIDEKRGLL